MFKIRKVKKVNFEKITIPAEFLKEKPSSRKLIRKTADYFETGKLEKIYVDKNFELVDGYCSYLIVKELGKEKVGSALKIRKVLD